MKILRLQSGCADSPKRFQFQSCSAKLPQGDVPSTSDLLARCYLCLTRAEMKSLDITVYFCDRFQNLVRDKPEGLSKGDHKACFWLSDFGNIFSVSIPLTWTYQAPPPQAMTGLVSIAKSPSHGVMARTKTRTKQTTTSGTVSEYI